MRLRRVRRRFGPPSRNSWSRTASRLDGPLYVAADGGTPYQGGFGYSGMTVNVSVRHVRPGGELDIDTSDDRDWHGDGDYDDWSLATDWLHRALQPGRISFPLALKADRWLQDVAVDGRNVPFTLVGDDRTWCNAT